jgi:segregation and condensation protein B
MEQPITKLSDLEIKSVVEALIYVAEEPLTEAALTELFGKDNREQIQLVLAQLVSEYQAPERGIEIKEVANGFRMGTKPEHHEWVRKFVKNQTPAVKLSLAALETLAVIAYKQSITLPEIQEIRGVNATGVIKTLIDRKLVTTAGRKDVIGRPILYRTTKEFLLHFGLKNLGELPSLEEFEELAKSDLGGTMIDTTVEEGPALQGILPLQLESGEPPVAASGKESGSKSAEDELAVVSPPENHEPEKSDE